MNRILATLVVVTICISAVCGKRPDPPTIESLVKTPEYMAKMRWGTYLSMYLHTMSERKRDTTTFGIMYYPKGSRNLEKDLRWRTVDVRDHGSFGYEYHNGEDFYQQFIEDQEFNVRFTITTLKSEYSTTSQEWSTRVTAKKIDQAKDLKINLIFYGTTKEHGSYFSLHKAHQDTIEVARRCSNGTDDFVCEQAKEYGEYRIGGKALAGAAGDLEFLTLNIANVSRLWDAKSIAMAYINSLHPDHDLCSDLRDFDIQHDHNTLITKIPFEGEIDYMISFKTVQPNENEDDDTPFFDYNTTIFEENHAAAKVIFEERFDRTFAYDPDF